jgi:hypothetical protein
MTAHIQLGPKASVAFATFARPVAPAIMGVAAFLTQGSYTVSVAHSAPAIRSVATTIVRQNTLIEMPLQEIGAGYLLKKPLTIRLEQPYDNEVIATFPEAGISISSDTISAAIADIKAELIDAFELHRAETQLGPELRRRKAILEDYIGERRHQNPPHRGRGYSQKA